MNSRSGVALSFWASGVETGQALAVAGRWPSAGTARIRARIDWWSARRVVVMRRGSGSRKLAVNWRRGERIGADRSPPVRADHDATWRRGKALTCAPPYSLT